MASINKAMLIGYLGSDPEFRQTSGGLMTANVNIATSSRRKGRDGQYEDVTEWHRLVFFDKLADVVHDCCRKGSMIYVEGRLQTRKWRDKDGIDRWSTEIVVQTLQLLDRKSSNEQQRPAPPPPDTAGAYGEEVPF